MFSEIKIYPENNADVLGIDVYKQSLERSFFYLKKIFQFYYKTPCQNNDKVLEKNRILIKIITTIRTTIRIKIRTIITKVLQIWYIAAHQRFHKIQNIWYDENQKRRRKPQPKFDKKWKKHFFEWFKSVFFYVTPHIKKSALSINWIRTSEKKWKT